MSYRFEKLIVWQKAMDFSLNIYDITKSFPKDEIFGITSQLKRAVISIPLNIAEGSACKTKKEFIQFLYIALRSEYEVVTILRIAYRLGYFDSIVNEEVETKIADIGKLLQALINSLQNNSNNKQPTTNNKKRKVEA
jgi:four helix bundle protein